MRLDSRYVSKLRSKEVQDVLDYVHGIDSTHFLQRTNLLNLGLVLTKTSTTPQCFCPWQKTMAPLTNRSVNQTNSNNNNMLQTPIDDKKRKSRPINAYFVETPSPSKKTKTGSSMLLGLKTLKGGPNTEPFYSLHVGDILGLSLIHISEPTRPY